MNYIYLHGFASGPASSKAGFFRARFAEAGIDLLVPDLAAGDFAHLTLSGQLRVLAGAAGNGPAVLIGSSLGGYLAALYAARHPETARLLLMAPAFGFPRRWPASLGSEQLARWRETGFLELYHYGDRCSRRLSHAILEDGARYEDFPAFTQPALIFHGTRDAAVPVDLCREFARGRPNVRLQEVDSDHELLDAVDRIWREARDFLLGPA